MSNFGDAATDNGMLSPTGQQATVAAATNLVMQRLDKEIFNLEKSQSACTQSALAFSYIASVLFPCIPYSWFLQNSYHERLLNGVIVFWQ
jgi:hypothetical protein